MAKNTTAKPKRRKAAKRKPPAEARQADIEDFAGPGADRAGLQTLDDNARDRRKAKRKGTNRGPISEQTFKLHDKLINEAELRWKASAEQTKKLKKTLNNRRKSLKEDGGDMLAYDFARAQAARLTGAVMSEQRSVGQYLKWMGSPIGEQWNLFPVDDERVEKLDARAQGEAAGRNGEPIDNCPFVPGGEDYAQYAEGWQAGQAELAQGIGQAT